MTDLYVGQPPLSAYPSLDSALAGETITFYLPITDAAMNPIFMTIQLCGKMEMPMVINSGATDPYTVPLDSVVPQPLPKASYAVGCQLAVGQAFTIPQDWRSSWYQVTFTDSACPPNTTFTQFVVRGDLSVARDLPPQAIIVIPLATSQAYNAWGGASLYVGPKDGDYIKAWDTLVLAHFSTQVAWALG